MLQRLWPLSLSMNRWTFKTHWSIQIFSQKPVVFTFILHTLYRCFQQILCFIKRFENWGKSGHWGQHLFWYTIQQLGLLLFLLLLICISSPSPLIMCRSILLLAPPPLYVFQIIHLWTMTSLYLSLSHNYISCNNYKISTSKESAFLPKTWPCAYWIMCF